MGDIWPYGPPHYTTYDTVVANLRTQGMDAANANIGAAVADYESSFDWMVVNDTPATGDYSVGLFQINYYDGLRPERVKMFGTPAHLATSGVSWQCYACYTLWIDSGWSPWAEVASGAYLPYLQGGGGGAPGGPASEPTLSEGATGTAVRTLQSDLNVLGYGLAVDGDFGPDTLAAVKAFQRAQSLTVDGVVGPLTWADLNAAVQAAGTAPPSESTGPAAPAEAPAGVDSGTLGAWSNLAQQTGPYVNSILQQLDTLAGANPGK